MTRAVLKKIEAFIKPFKLEEVKCALFENFDIDQMTIMEAKGYLNSRPAFAEYVVDFLPKIKIEIFLDLERSQRVNEIVETIQQFAYTGKKGDGIIVVSDGEQLISIRTGIKAVPDLAPA